MATTKTYAAADVAVVNKTQLSNGAIAVTLRCNNDPQSDSVATLYVTPTADVASWVAKEKARVAVEYNGMQAALAAFEKL